MNKLHLNSKVLVIAEAGVNHNGDINLAKKLKEIS
jgi:sialic acid synthase SpsE